MCTHIHARTRSRNRRRSVQKTHMQTETNVTSSAFAHTNAHTSLIHAADGHFTFCTHAFEQERKTDISSRRLPEKASHANASSSMAIVELVAARLSLLCCHHLHQYTPQMIHAVAPAYRAYLVFGAGTGGPADDMFTHNQYFYQPPQLPPFPLSSFCLSTRFVRLSLQHSSLLSLSLHTHEHTQLPLSLHTHTHTQILQYSRSQCIPLQQLTFPHVHSLTHYNPLSLSLSLIDDVLSVYRDRHSENYSHSLLCEGSLWSENVKMLSTCECV